MPPPPPRGKAAGAAAAKAAEEDGGGHMDWLEAVVLAAAAGTGTYVNDELCLNFKGP